ncbi:hypothetical protein DFJ73DRAFT_794475 [Zopfochytrium polystomum]|nr:hypothetical protein DFJ73DRAFT_794475 [Zopfochytrium polystomum]
MRSSDRAARRVSVTGYSSTHGPTIDHHHQHFQHPVRSASSRHPRPTTSTTTPADADDDAAATPLGSRLSFEDASNIGYVIDSPRASRAPSALLFPPPAAAAAAAAHVDASSSSSASRLSISRSAAPTPAPAGARGPPRDPAPTRRASNHRADRRRASDFGHFLVAARAAQEHLRRSLYDDGLVGPADPDPDDVTDYTHDRPTAGASSEEASSLPLINCRTISISDATHAHTDPPPLHHHPAGPWSEATTAERVIEASKLLSEQLSAEIKHVEKLISAAKSLGGSVAQLDQGVGQSRKASVMGPTLKPPSAFYPSFYPSYPATVSSSIAFSNNYSNPNMSVLASGARSGSSFLFPPTQLLRGSTESRNDLALLKMPESQASLRAEFPSVNYSLFQLLTEQESVQIHSLKDKTVTRSTHDLTDRPVGLQLAQGSLSAGRARSESQLYSIASRYNLQDFDSSAPSLLGVTGLPLSATYEQRSREVLTSSEIRNGIMSSEAFAVVNPEVLALHQRADDHTLSKVLATVLSTMGRLRPTTHIQGRRSSACSDAAADGVLMRRSMVDSLVDDVRSNGGVESNTLQRPRNPDYLSVRHGSKVSIRSQASIISPPPPTPVDGGSAVLDQPAFDPRPSGRVSTITAEPPPKEPFVSRTLSASREAKQTRHKPFYLRWHGINPEGLFATFWDLLMIVPYFLILAFVPATLGFPDIRTHDLDRFTTALTFLLPLDTVVRAFIYRPLEPVSIVATLATNTRKPSFAIDVLTAIPLRYLGRRVLMLPPNVADKLLAVVLLRVHRLRRLLKVRPLFLLFTHIQLHLNIGESATAVLSVIATMAAFLHVQACLILWFGHAVAFGDDFWTSPRVKTEMGLRDPEDLLWWEAYSVGIWNAVSNFLMVTSDFRPTTVGGHWVHILLVVIGASMSAALTGTISAYYSISGSSLDAQFRRRMDELLEYFSVQKLGNELQRRVTTAVETKYNGRVFDERKILNSLNPSLRQEVTLSNCADILKSLDFINLENIDEARRSWMMREIGQGLRHLVYGANETIYKQGLYGSSMFLLVDGYAVVRLGAVKIGFLSPGSYFGELCLMAPAARLETVESLTKITCMELDRETLNRAVARIPEMLEHMAKIRLKRIEAIDRLCEQLFEEDEDADGRADGGGGGRNANEDDSDGDNDGEDGEDDGDGVDRIEEEDEEKDEGGRFEGSFERSGGLGSGYGIPQFGDA